MPARLEGEERNSLLRSVSYPHADPSPPPFPVSIHLETTTPEFPPSFPLPFFTAQVFLVTVGWGGGGKNLGSVVVVVDPFAC